MKLGVRSKLLLVSVVLIAGAVLAGGAYFEVGIKGWIANRTEIELQRHARVASLLIGEPRVARTGEGLDALVGRLSVAQDARITVIDVDGRVLADSDVSYGDLGALDNHGSRIEVLDALRGGVGVARRYSHTLQQDMIYVAVPYGPKGAPAGVVRAAQPLVHETEAIGRLRRALLGTSLVAVLLAVLLSGLASQLLWRTVRDLVRNARAVAEGKGRRVDVPKGDDLGGLAGSINQIAQELERVVATLADERNLTQAVLESMREAVVALDPEQRVRLLNTEARTLLGLTGQSTGRTLMETARIPGLQQLAGQAAEQGLAEAELQLPGKPVRRVLARAAAMAGGGGVVLMMHDVTELRRLETIRRDFVANVSHELRTPVSVILANAETLLGGALDDPESARGFTEALARNAERLSKLVTDLLDISRIESDRQPLELLPQPVSALARRAAQTVEMRAQSKDIALRIDVSGALWVSADARGLEQILVNLLDNAVKYTPPGGHVSVAASSSEGRVRIEVADDGPGIEPSHRARVFERFYRVDPGRSREMGGTGLGLSIVKNLAESMGGRVGLDPGSPRGSVFWVLLPSASAPQLTSSAVEPR